MTQASAPSHKIQAILAGQKGGHGPSHSIQRLETEDDIVTLLTLQDRIRCFAKKVLVRVVPFTFISHTK